MTSVIKLSFHLIDVPDFIKPRVISLYSTQHTVLSLKLHVQWSVLLYRLWFDMQQFGKSILFYQPQSPHAIIRDLSLYTSHNNAY